MISEASLSKTPPSAPPSPELPSSSPRPTLLAPGFRFHPTDEELVSYYLKRKITGRPIRVDAISEVDLYKLEPWDLPPRSRLRSRDLEWYFFTALDRKYSNRCRTNRATPDGFWKTTGNDRPVHRRSRTVGKKKTLVYHAGRAPRGKRTNWVMHEYRLEDEDLSRAGLLQDGYVLCRIFQKSGSGPQNGAQYGAPYMEEEWEKEEEDDANLVPVSRDLDDTRMDPANEDYVHLDDFLQNHGTGFQQLDAVPFANTKPAKQEMGSNTEDSSFSIDEIPKDHIFVEDCTGHVDFPAMQDIQTLLNGLGENTTVEDQSNGASIQNNGYVQMKDIFTEQNICFTPDGYLNDCLLRRENDISLVDGVDHSENLPVKHASRDFDTNGASSQPDQLQIRPLYLDLCDIGNASTEDASAQLAEDNLVYYDALGIDVQHLEESFMNEASLVPRNEFDFLEELMAYYDATDDTLHYATQDSCMSEFKPFNSTVAESSAPAEAVGRSTSLLDAVDTQEKLAKYASLDKAPNIDGNLGGFSQNLEKDVQQKIPQGKTLINRLGSMLESISAPPAFAAEPAMIREVAGQISATSTSSLHVTAGMIQIQNLTAMGFSESWMLRKHIESNFMFSRGLNGRLAHKSAPHEPVKEHCGILSLVLRDGFHFFFLSALLLALSYRVGVHVCNL